MKVTTEEQLKVLKNLVEGDMFECGRPFVFDPKEPLVWQCQEAALAKDGSYRYTLHLYWHGIFLKSVIATVAVGSDKVEWSYVSVQ